MVQKKRYLKPEEAIKAADLLNLDVSKLHYFSAYKCTTCHFFHVGKNNKIREDWGKQ
jgi:hypothetical protein